MGLLAHPDWTTVKQQGKRSIISQHYTQKNALLQHSTAPIEFIKND